MINFFTINIRSFAHTKSAIQLTTNRTHTCKELVDKRARITREKSSSLIGAIPVRFHIFRRINVTHINIYLFKFKKMEFEQAK